MIAFFRGIQFHLQLHNITNHIFFIYGNNMDGHKDRSNTE